ncbi:MAG: YdcF family protein [Anaerolineaceae bacterium]|nr:YdcF family protein [Anaerolineaceae bacterium]
MMKKILIVAIILIILTGVFSALLQPIGDYLIIQDKPKKVDMIVTSSGAEYRTDYAIELYKQGLASKLFFTGGYSEKNQRIEAEWSRRLALDAGAPDDAVIIDTSEVISTYQEALRLRSYLDAHNETITTIMIVTDPYHTRRAKWAYKTVFGDQIKVRMVPVPFESTNLSITWWKDAESRKMVWNEYVKLVFYVIRYELSAGELKTWLTRFDKI